MPFRTTTTVRFGDVDHAGIVYYPQFYIYFHEAFEDLFNLNQVPYFEVMNQQRIGFPTVHVETDFKSPLRYGDSLDLELSVVKLSQRSLIMQYQGYRHRDGQLSVIAKTTLACVDMNTFKSRPIPDPLRELFTRFLI